MQVSEHLIRPPADYKLDSVNLHPCTHNFRFPFCSLGMRKFIIVQESQKWTNLFFFIGEIIGGLGGIGIEIEIP